MENFRFCAQLTLLIILSVSGRFPDLR